MQFQKYICLDEKCEVKCKIGCADCFLDFHEGHKKILIDSFTQKHNTKSSTLMQLSGEMLNE